MANVTLAWDSANSRADWLLTPSGLVTGQALESAVLVSLFSDRRALPDDKLAPGDNPRGWWGDSFAAQPIGSRLWLLLRSKRTTETLRRARDMIADALAWIVDDGIAASVDVAPEWINRGMLGARVTLRQHDGTARTLSFAWLWEAPPPSGRADTLDRILSNAV